MNPGRIGGWVAIAGLAVAFSAPALAGTISLTWDPVPDASGYRVYFGDTAGQYARSPIDVGGATECTIPDLSDCTRWYLAVKAYNAYGESEEFSDEISGLPQPVVAKPAPVAAMQGDQITLNISGANFEPGATVEIDNPNVMLTGARALSCTQMQVVATVEPRSGGVPPAKIGWFRLTVVNPDQVIGGTDGAFEVQINPARFDVNARDATTRGRLDGKDTVWLSRLFGSRDSDPDYDPDSDLNGDGWVDGEDLVHVASNFGRCWSGGSWTASACQAVPTH